MSDGRAAARRDIAKGMSQRDKSNPLERVDEELLDSIETKGGFSTRLKFSDLQKLRAIVKKVHLRHYPTEMISDYEADRVIDVMGPVTQEYLVRKAVEMGL